MRLQRVIVSEPAFEVFAEIVERLVTCEHATRAIVIDGAANMAARKVSQFARIYKECFEVVEFVGSSGEAAAIGIGIASSIINAARDFARTEHEIDARLFAPS